MKDYQYHFKILSYSVLCLSLHKNKSGWVRFFGVGFSWTHKSNPKLFSERVGKRKKLNIFCYRFGFFETNINIEL
jgi:hypothetical protein